MARIPQITAREDVPEDKRHIFDAIAASRGRVPGLFSVLLNSPEVAGRVAHLGSYVRAESTLSPPHRELVIITTAREFDCDYVWADHEPLARQAGVREEAIQVVANRGALESLTEDEGIIVRYGRELLPRPSRLWVHIPGRKGSVRPPGGDGTDGHYGLLCDDGVHNQRSRDRAPA